MLNAWRKVTGLKPVWGKREYTVPYMPPLVNISYQSRIISQYRARHSYKKSLQSCIPNIQPYPLSPHKTLSSTSPPFPTGGEWDHPPLMRWPRRPPPTYSKRNETSQPIDNYTIETRSRCRGWTKGQPFPYPDKFAHSHRSRHYRTPIPFTLSIEVSVLTKGGLSKIPPTPRRESGVRGVGSY